MAADRHPDTQRPTGCPLLLLDIDGTLAPMSKRLFLADGTPHVTDWKNLPVGGWIGSIFYSASILNALLRLHLDGRLRIEWLTTWESEAVTAFGRPLWLPDFTAHTARSSTAPVGQPGADSDWWKARVVARLLSEGNRLIWADDELAEYLDPDEGEQAVRDLVRAAGDRLLVLAPDSHEGLTSHHINLVRHFVGSVPA